MISSAGWVVPNQGSFDAIDCLRGCAGIGVSPIELMSQFTSVTFLPGVWSSLEAENLFANAHKEPPRID